MHLKLKRLWELHNDDHSCSDDKPHSGDDKSNGFSPPPSTRHSLRMGPHGEPVYIRADGGIEDERPADFVGDAVNSDFSLCWCIDVWCELVSGKGPAATLDATYLTE
eukprot:SAG11_NODE_533_length_8703_cov_7.183054_7_plen_107_part_00